VPDDTITIPAPQIVTKDAMTISGLRTRHLFEGFDPNTFPALWQQLRSDLAAANLPIGGAIYDLFWDMFGDEEAFVLLTGVVLPEDVPLPTRFVQVTLPQQRYAVVPHLGARDTSNETVYALWKTWLPDSGYQPTGGLQFVEAMDTETAEVEIWAALAD
jgi:predicted transcriptional regulator YdeE